MSKKARASVLVAEDSLAAAKRLQFCLERSGFSVEIAADGRDAWQKAQKHKFDVIVTDEQMPVMTGRELCRRLRDDSRYANTSVILLTARLAELDTEELKNDLQITTTFDKPFSSDALVRAIESELAGVPASD